MALQLYQSPATAARELAIREPYNEEARAQRLADVSLALVLARPWDQSVLHSGLHWIAMPEQYEYSKPARNCRRKCLRKN